jgi:antitoxin VapB
MALSIKNSETERLARQVARETGESLTGAIEKALQERLERLKQPPQGRLMTEKLEDILRRVDALPALDARPEDEILGYDREGIPLWWALPVVIDTSALLAIFLGDEERKQFLDRITRAETRLISAATVLETGIVLEARRGEAAGREFDLFLHQAKF